MSVSSLSYLECTAFFGINFLSSHYVNPRLSGHLYFPFTLSMSSLWSRSSTSKRLKLEHLREDSKMCLNTRDPPARKSSRHFLAFKVFVNACFLRCVTMSFFLNEFLCMNSLLNTIQLQQNPEPWLTRKVTIRLCKVTLEHSVNPYTFLNF